MEIETFILNWQKSTGKKSPGFPWTIFKMGNPTNQNLGLDKHYPFGYGN